MPWRNPALQYWTPGPIRQLRGLPRVFRGYPRSARTVRYVRGNPGGGFGINDRYARIQRRPNRKTYRRLTTKRRAFKNTPGVASDIRLAKHQLKYAD